MLPSLVIGVLLSYPANIYVVSIFKNSIGAEFSPMPTVKATLYALFLGVMMPLIASIWPVRSAMKSSLNLALDMVHSKSMGVKIELL